MDDKKYFYTLDENHPLFKNLMESPPYWWSFLKEHTSQEYPADERLYINIRKDNTIDVYHQGGLLVAISYNENDYEFKTHYKYATDKVDGANSELYVAINIDEVVNKVGFKNFLRRIHEHYSQKSKNGYSEKYIQAEIYSEGNYIDTEFAYIGFPFEYWMKNRKNGQLKKRTSKNIRIDLLRYDKEQNRLTFVELKRESDGRLLCAKNKKTGERPNPEILTQMKAYNAFVSDKQKDLLDYYIKLIQISKGIGLLNENIDTETLTFNTDVELLIQSPENPSIQRQKRDKAIEEILNIHNITYKWR